MNRLWANCPINFGIALYKGVRPFPDGIANRVGRYLDNGPYSHFEMVYSDGMSGGASFIDKGVRVKEIQYRSRGCWDFMRIPDRSGMIEAASRQWMLEHDKAPYDLPGNIRFAFGAVRDNPDHWFCSESGLASLGVPEPYRYGPSGAATLLSWYYRTKIIVMEKQP